jgi:hypothetical protein
VRCSTCGEEHDVLEPAFRRPDAIAAMSQEERARRVKETDDLCAIWAPQDDDRHRYFVRAILPVELLDAERDTAWGLWVEVASADFHHVVEKWSDADQVREPPISGVLANRVAGYPDTIGLAVELQLAGPTSRPKILLDPASTHPFVVECRAGVCTHRVADWLAGR